MKLLQGALFSAAAVTQIYAETREERYLADLKKIDFQAVKADILDLLHSSKEEFPSDYGNYGPFMIRHAWHCAGTYRASDGEGGCDGGRQRFEPERSWDDNTNLDKAKKLLFPIKEKYGNGLSWGDLIILTGTLAIEDMGAPILGFCAGRLDDLNGDNSEILGPNALQEETAPCPVNGNCSSPMGATTKQLIYVNPGGFLGVPDPTESNHIRDAFGRMSMNDTETVALIGGGHSFGKTHGACPDGPGDKPKDNPEHPWEGTCGGNGIGVNTFTSGFEGPWTADPTAFDNSFFTLLRDFKFKLITGPGGGQYWIIDEEQTPNGPTAPTADLAGQQKILMLTTDLSLIVDPLYEPITLRFAEDPQFFADQFAHAWYKLVTRDMGPVSRCFGNEVPAAQEFQGPLPDAPKTTASFAQVKDDVEDLFEDKEGSLALAVELAYQCAATFRVTDHHGGCNGARIRLSPQNQWPDRVPVLSTIDDLQDIKKNYNDKVLSNADLIVFAGTAALEAASGANLHLSFCPGRVDAESDTVSDILKLFQYEDKALQFRRQARLFDLPVNLLVALTGRPRSAKYMQDLGYSGTYTDDENTFSNVFFKTLLEETWNESDNTGIFGAEYVNADGTKFITRNDFVLTLDPESLAAVFEYAADEDLFFADFATAWTQLMNADRFDGPVENLCSNGKVDLFQLSPKETDEPTPCSDNGNAGSTLGVSMLALGATVAGNLIR